MRKGSAAHAYRQAKTPARRRPEKVIDKVPAGRSSPRGFIPHPRFGKNPTIPVCFWCSKARNELVNLGATYPGEAPLHMVVDYRPCEVCEAKHAEGVLFVEVSHARNGMLPPMTQDANGNPLYPVNRWTVATKTPELIAAMAGHEVPAVYVDTARFNEFFGEPNGNRAVESPDVVPRGEQPDVDGGTVGAEQLPSGQLQTPRGS